MNHYACGTPIIYRRNLPGLEWEDIPAEYIGERRNNKHKIVLKDGSPRYVSWASIRPVNGGSAT